VLPIPGRYNTDGPWLKGNTHVHTTCSDGAMHPGQAAAAYAEAGYDFIFVTDHGRAADVESLPDLPLLALNGIEIDGTDETGSPFHAVGLGCDEEPPQGRPFGESVAWLKQVGAVVIVAHPYWTGNSVEDVLRHGFDGVEVYNTVCDSLNGKGLSAYHWDCMLTANPRTVGVSADDAHFGEGQRWNRGWIMVSAPELSRASILEAIRAGNFYSTQGPLFDSIRVSEDRIRVRTSPVAAIRLTDCTAWGERLWARDGETLTEAEFVVTGEHAYLRLEIEDERGLRAWTNALFESDTSPSSEQAG